MKKYLEANRGKISEELNAAEDLQYFSPVTYASYRITKPCIEQYIHGQTIDVGCGHMPYKTLFAQHASKIDTFDIEERVGGVTYIGDIQDMYMIPDARYDSLACFEVLEHVPHPAKALSELNRILKPGGTAVLSVPHLSRLHEQPHDYFRYTKYGLDVLLQDAGFEVVQCQHRGGLVCFLGHQWSTVWLCFFWRVPVLKQIVLLLNKWLCVKFCYWLDCVFDKDGLMANGYTVVARKL